MPFEFKLSRRLAQSRTAIVGLFVILAACYADNPSRPSADFLIVISPSALTVSTLQQVAFSVDVASPEGAFDVGDRRIDLGQVYTGGPATLANEWSATGGIIDQSGRFAAGAEPGDYMVIVTHASGAADTAYVTVVPGASSPVLSQIILQPPSAQMSPGSSLQFAAFGRLSNGDSTAVSVTFDASGGTVSSDGLYVAGDTPGTYTVIATESGGLADSSVVSINAVQPTLQRIALVPASAALFTGGTQQFRTDGVLSNGDSLPVAAEYTTTSGTIGSDGFLVAGNEPGDYLVIATVDGGAFADTANVTVSLAPVANVVVTPASATLGVGETVQLTATPTDASGNPLSGRQVTWESSDPAVANVSAAGVVAGGAAGSATITAVSEGVSGSAEITVAAAVSSVEVAPTTAALTVGGTVQLTATAKDAAGNSLQGRAIAWSSDNSSVATVSADGLVTAVAQGTATVAATSDGKSGSAQISVGAASVSSVDVSPANMSLTVGQSGQFTAVPRDGAGNALQGHTIDWSSSNSAVASVAADGRVTAASVGSATITATADGVSGTATVGVTQPPATGGVRAFPGAEGFGAFATGGRGGTVYHVTNTNTGGPGSLWDALQASGPRTIVFDISGNFDVPANGYGDYFVTNGDLTIAGQTAPGDGVTLRGGTMHFFADNVIVRYIRVRPGLVGEGQHSAITFAGNTGIFDHLSVSWHSDEGVNLFRNANNVTVQWSIVGEAISGGHGILVAIANPDANATLHHNLLVSNRIRTPFIGSNPDGNHGKTTAEVINNVGYNWWCSCSLFGHDESPSRVYRINFMSNWYQMGPSVRAPVSEWGWKIWQTPNTPNTNGPTGIMVFEDNNMVNGTYPGHPNGATWPEFSPMTWAQAPIPIDPSRQVQRQDVLVAKDLVLDNAGAIVPRRDPVDERLVADVRNGTGFIPGTVNDVGGWPTLASAAPPADGDRDGMADDWESARGLNPNDPNDRNGDRDGDGYTNLEEYLDWLLRQ